ncbi:MAG: hypothetical protein ACE5F7_01950 [Nitrospiria bacterium]
MTKKALLKQIIKETPGLDPSFVKNLLDSMDRDYLKECGSSEIAEHIVMVQSLSPENLVQLRIKASGPRRYKVTVVAFDYFSEFSIICGLFSSLGFNIIGGNVQTLSGLRGRKKIIDLFEIQPIGNGIFDTQKQAVFTTELKALIELLEQAHFREARSRVNQRLISHIGQTQDQLYTEGLLKGLLRPIQIRFDNSRSKHWTILNIHGQDTPAFLYAFSNALAMRNIYIYKIKILHEPDQIHDRLYIANRQGRKITRNHEKKALQIAAVLIKQFTHFLPAAPDPAMAITHFDQFLDKILETANARPLIAFLKQEETMKLLARFFGTSNFLWEDFLRIRFDTLFPILEQFRGKALIVSKDTLRRNLNKRLQSADDFKAKQTIVNTYKDEELFRIDLRHLHEPAKHLLQFSEALTRLAEVIVSVTLKTCMAHLDEKYGVPRLENGRRAPFTVFGLGKFGGRELGYASDIELIFVYGENGRTGSVHSVDSGLYFEALAQEIVKFIEARQAGIFQIDTRLRPYGKSGRWATSFKQFESYYSSAGKAAPFERQALIKLRAVAGSRALGHKCLAARDRFVYSGSAWEKTDAVELRALQLDELVPKGRVNVKYSPGGLVEIEYLTQYLQIIHGHALPALRTPNTLEALDALSKAAVIDTDTHHCLKKNYLFLRFLVDALRIVRGNAKDLLLPDAKSDEFVFLARRMGFAKKNWRLGGRRLADTISKNMAEVHRHYEGFNQPSPTRH